jgi:hypothetical protein
MICKENEEVARITKSPLGKYCSNNCCRTDPMGAKINRLKFENKT